MSQPLPFLPLLSASGELTPNLAEVACHRYARRLLLNILSPRNPRYLPEAVVQALPKATEGGGAQAHGYESEDEDEGDGEESDGAEDDDDFITRKGSGGGAEEDGGSDKEEEEEEGEGGAAAAAGGAKRAPVAVSKKPASVRRAELLGKAGKLGDALASLCAGGAWMLMRNPMGADVLFEVARGGDGGELLKAVGPEKIAAVRRAVALEAALEASAERSTPGGASGKKDPAFMRGGLEEAVAGAGKLAAAAEAEALWAQPTDAAGDHYVASRLLRRLVLEPPAASGGGVAGVGPVLWEAAIKGRCKAWVAGHRAKVAAAVASCGDVAVEKAAGAELAPLVKPQTVAAWAKQFVGQESTAEGAPKPQKGAVQADGAAKGGSRKRSAAEPAPGAEEDQAPPAKNGAATSAKKGARPAGAAAAAAPAASVAQGKKAAAAPAATAAAGERTGAAAAAGKRARKA